MLIIFFAFVFFLLINVFLFVMVATTRRLVKTDGDGLLITRRFPSLESSVRLLVQALWNIVGSRSCIATVKFGATVHFLRYAVTRV